MTVRTSRRRRTPRLLVAAAVTPLASWRVPISAVAVTGSTNNTTYQAALLASPANRDLPTVQVAAGGTAVITWTAGTISAPGAILYLTTSVGSAGKRTITASYSSDGFATSTAIPYTPAQTVAGTNNVDDLIEVPAAASGAQIRLAYANSDTATQAFRVQLNQLQSDPAANDLHAIVGMSITVTNTQAGQIADQIRSVYPGRDPICLVTARSGAKPANYLTEQLQGILQSRSYIKRLTTDLGVNDRVSGSAQWSNLTTAQQNQIKSDAAAISTWAASNNRILSYVDTTFVNPGTYNGETYTVNQEGVTENGAATPIANQDNGTRPYIINAYAPVLKAQQNSWNTLYDTPAWDGYLPSLMSWDLWKQTLSGLTLQDGVHPGTLGAPQYRAAIVDAYGAQVGGSPAHYLLRKVVAAEEKGSTTAQKNRLFLGLLSLPPTADSNAQAARAALQTRIGNISTSYVEVPGQTAPSSLSGMVASFDFDDQGTIYSDNSGSVGIKDGELAISIASKVGSSKLTNTATRTSTPYVQPRWLLGDVLGSRGLVFDGGGTVLTSTDTALTGAIDAAAAPFIIGWIDVGMQPSLRSSWGLLSGGTNRLIARTQSGGMAVQIVGQSAVIGTESSAPAIGSSNVYVLSYDGTTLKLRRNGIETLSVAYSKPAWTGDTLRMGGAASGSNYLGMKRGWHLISGTWAAGTVAALESRLRAQAGV